MEGSSKNSLDISCICKTNTRTEKYETAQCKACLRYMHLICYDIPPYDDRLNFFECILCRVQKCDPFSELKKLVIEPFILPTNYQKIELNETFHLNKQQVEALQENVIQLMIFCTKIKIEKEEEFPYEWPSESITLLINGRLLPKCLIFSPIFMQSSKEDGFFHIGPNTFTIKIPKENKENTYPKSVMGVCLIEKKEIKLIAKKVAAANRLSFTEAKKRYYSTEQADLEMLASFPIKDPLTLQLMFMPTRGEKCKHLSCFDLMNFLKFNFVGKTDLRWKCPICRKPTFINDLVVDLYLHKILKDIKSGLSNQYTDKDIEKCSYICFDEKGDWKLKQNFSDEWSKQNKKYDKPPRSNFQANANKQSEYSYSTSNNNNFSMNIETESHHEKEDVIIMNETSNLNCEGLSSSNRQSNSLYAEEITVEHSVMIYKNILSSIEKIQLTSSEIADNISIKLKEFNVFKNFSAKKFYEFLIQAEINIYIDSFFDEGRNLLECMEFEELCENAVKSPSAEIAKYALAWALNKENITEIVYLICTKSETHGLDIKFALELLIIFSYLIYKRKITISVNRKHLFATFGEILNCFAQKLGFQKIHFQKVFAIFSVVLPDLNFPFFVSKAKCYEFYEQLSDFFIAFMAHLPFETFKEILISTHLPPFHALEDVEDRRLARHFLYFFVLTLKKKDGSLQLPSFYDVLSEWDIHNQMRSFMHKEKIHLFMVTLEENDLKNFSY